MVSKNIFPFFIFIIIIFYAFIEGGGMPNLWSTHYYLPSFFDGFYRRALPGTILSFLGDLRFNYYTVAIVQLSILVALLVWIFLIFKKNILFMLLISLYLISPAGAYFFHEVGYIEQLLYLILFISIIIFDKHKTMSVLLFSLSILIHELTLFVTLPIFFTYIYIVTQSLKKSIYYSIPTIILFIIIYVFFQTVPIDVIKTFIEKFLTTSNYHLQSDFYLVFTNTFTGARNTIYYDSDSLSHIFLLFSIISITSYIVYRLSKKQIMLAVLVFATGVQPLLLGFFGWDVYRWYFLSLTSLTIIFILVLQQYKTTLQEIFSMKYTAILYIIFYLLIISNMFLKYFGEERPRPVNLDSIKAVQNTFFKIPLGSEDTHVSFIQSIWVSEVNKLSDIESIVISKELGMNAKTLRQFKKPYTVVPLLKISSVISEKNTLYIVPKHIVSSSKLNDEKVITMNSFLNEINTSSLLKEIGGKDSLDIGISKINDPTVLLIKNLTFMPAEFSLDKPYLIPLSKFKKFRAFQGEPLAMSVSGAIMSPIYTLKKNKYFFTVNAKGTQAFNEYAKLKLKVFKMGETNTRIVEYYVDTKDNFTNFIVPFEVKETCNISFVVTFINDSARVNPKEDRNVYLKSIQLQKF